MIKATGSRISVVAPQIGEGGFVVGSAAGAALVSWDVKVDVCVGMEAVAEGMGESVGTVTSGAGWVDPCRC